MMSWRSIFISIFLSAIVAMGVACSGNEQPGKLTGVKTEGSQSAAVEQKDQPAGSVAQQSQSGTEAPAQTARQSVPAELPKAIELIGTVEQSGDGIVIVTDMGKYNVIGEDLSQMVGKTVKVTGAVEESAGQYAINVESFEETN